MPTTGDRPLGKEAGTTTNKAEIVCVSILEERQLLPDQRTRPDVGKEGWL
jgi:hypothetical protein